MPESYSILKQHHTLPIFNLVFDPMTLTCCFCFLSNAKDTSFSSVILFDTGTGHTYKENKISLSMDKDEEHKKHL